MEEWASVQGGPEVEPAEALGPEPDAAEARQEVVQERKWVPIQPHPLCGRALEAVRWVVRVEEANA